MELRAIPVLHAFRAAGALAWRCTVSSGTRCNSYYVNPAKLATEASFVRGCRRAADSYPLVAGSSPAGSTCVRWSGDFDIDGDGHVSAREVGNGAMRVGPFDDLA